MDDLHIVTVATEIDYYMPYLIESCKKNGKELIILGYKEKWKGFNWRFKLMLNYLKTLNNNDIVCFIDGYDVICTRNLAELKNEFIKLKNETNSKIIVSEDKFVKTNLLSNFLRISQYFYFDLCNGLNLNAGTYIGYVYDLIEILQEIYNIDPNDNADDQILLTKYCKINNNIYIDTNNKIFLTLGNLFSEIDKEVISNNKIIYNNNIPFFIHGPGTTYLDNIVKFLGYSLKDDQIKKKIIKKSLDKIPYYLKDSYTVQLLLLLCLLIIILLIKNLVKFIYK
jgi:hypothetical protein